MSNSLSPWVVGLIAALFGNVLYHLMSKAVAGGKPFTTLALVYGMAMLIAGLLAYFAESARPADLARVAASPSVLLLAIAVVMIEAGFLWAYAHGAPIGTSSLIVNAAVAAALAVLGVLLFQEVLNARLFAGFGLTLAGVWLIGTARAAG